MWTTLVNPSFLALCALVVGCGEPLLTAPRSAPVPAASATEPELIRVLGFNDFHGNLLSARKVEERSVGGAAVLTAYLERATNEVEGRALIVHAGDHVGASPPVSALLQDEPSIQFLNLLANSHCSYEQRDNERCNVVGTLGNHEFDEGKDELLRLVNGGDSPRGPFLQSPYQGARFSYVCSNVVDSQTQRPLIQPFVVRQVGAVRVGVVGAVVRTTPTIVTPTGVASLTFLDEADAINAAVQELRQQGVRTIIVTIHEGGEQAPYEGFTSANATLEGDIVPIVTRLDDEVDVVVSGHAHRFSNALVRNRTGKPILVTQAFSAGIAYAQIDLSIDRWTGDVIHKQAQVIMTFADAKPVSPLADKVEALVSRAEAAVGPRVNRVVGTTLSAIARQPLDSGESALGNLIADAQRAMAGTDLALTNLGGIRADLDAGQITWGELFTIQPFGNSLVRMELSGARLVELLEQQWLDPEGARMLQVSGFSYSWSGARAAGAKIVDVRVNGAPLDLKRTYSVVMNNFLAEGGDAFRGGALGVNHVTLGGDLDALVRFVEAHAEALPSGITQRILRLE